MISQLRVVFDIRSLPLLIWRYRELFVQMTLRGVESRYRGAFLGLIWSFARPLLMLSVYTFVFSVIFKSRWSGVESEVRGSFAIVMFCGLALFSQFSESVCASCACVSGQRNLVQQVVFPLEILPLSLVTSVFVQGIVWLLLLFAGTFLVFGHLHWTVVFVPLVLLPLYFLTIGFSLFFSALGVYMRDIGHFVPVVVQMLFFMTPIFYSLDSVPERFRVFLELNPLAMLVEESRKMVIYGQLPDFRLLAIMMVVCFAVAHLGFAWFHKTSKGFADVI